MAKQASYCKECGKKLTFFTKSFDIKDMCLNCYNGEENLQRIRENKRRKGHCKVCGEKLRKHVLNADRTAYLKDVCSDCEFAKYEDGKPVRPGKFMADYIGGYGAFPEPKYVKMLTYPDHLEVPELRLTISYTSCEMSKV
jgi:hypothetical protein